MVYVCCVVLCWVCVWCGGEYSQKDCREARSRLGMLDLHRQQLQELMMRNEQLTLENNKLSADLKLLTTNLLTADASTRQQLTVVQQKAGERTSQVEANLEGEKKDKEQLQAQLKAQKSALDDVWVLCVYVLCA